MFVACAAAWGAWLTQDAYISFRYAENFAAGHGLVFNVGERVQGFTHPFWMLLLCAGPIEHIETYALALGVAFTLAGAALLGLSLARLRNAVPAIVFLGLALASSRSFREWSTSGLENSLSHACLAGVIALAALGRRPGVGPALFGLAVGLLALNRIDQLPLVAPLAVWIVWNLGEAERGGRFRAAALFAVGLAPLFVWLLFAAVYYGFPFPNTGYAKIGSVASLRLAQGVRYLHDFALYEPWHAALIAAAPLAGLLCGAWRRDRLGALSALLGLGVACQLAYLAWVGGDYMRGRFVASSLFVAATVVAFGLATLLESRPRAAWGTSLLLGAALVMAQFWTLDEPPFNAQTGVARISATYAPFKEFPAGQARTLSQIRAARRGLTMVGEFNQAYGEFTIRNGNLGDDTFGFGPTVPIVDPHGLVDAYVARCRPSPRNRPGHVQRAVPLAYYQSRRCIDLLPGWHARLDALDASLAREVEQAAANATWLSEPARQVYDDLTVLTRGPILSWPRLKLVMKYTFTTPLAYDPASPAPVLAPSDVSPELFRVADPIARDVTLLGIDPSAFDFCDPLVTQDCWLGPGEDGQVSFYLRAPHSLTALLVTSLELGRAFPDCGSCHVALVRDGITIQETLVPSDTRTMLLTMPLLAGEQRIDLRILSAPGSQRFFLDPRPLMIFVRQFELRPMPQ